MISLAVIGDPISHSKSPAIHSAVMEQLNIPYEYSSFCVKKGELEGFIKLVHEKKIDGFNITMPHKTDILPFLTEIDEEARRYNAVNTVKVDGGKLYGYNTDAEGFTASLQDCGFTFEGKNVVFLGAGGVVSTLARKAAYEGAEKVSILNRTVSNAEAISTLVAEETGVKAECAGFDISTLKRFCKDTDLLINATPLGMHSTNHDYEDLSFINELKTDAFVSDLIYNPLETAFLAAAKAHGCRIMNGMGMLLYQAFLADTIYTGTDFSFSDMKAKIEKDILV